MKKWMASLLMGLALVSLLWGSAMAAQADGGFQAIVAPDSVSIIPQTAAGARVQGKLVNGVLTYMGAEKLAVTAAGPAGTYMVLLVEGKVDAPREGCVVYYVNQAQSVNGVVSFSVHPTLQRAGEYTLFITSDVWETRRATLQYVDGESGGFIDVPAGSWFQSAVRWAVDRGVTSGTGGGTFSPHRACTRAEAMTFLWRAAGSPNPGWGESFADVEKGSYYEKAVQWAVALGITRGTGEGLFSPHVLVDRSQAVTFLQRFAGGEAAYDGQVFSDVPGDAYYAQAVGWAVERGITNGTGERTFSPLKSCTRAEIVTFLYRMFG